MITLKVDNQAHLYPESQLPGYVLNQIKDRLTFANPAFEKAEKQGRYTGNIPQEIRGYRLEGDNLLLPRGFTAQLVEIIRAAGLAYRVEDHRRVLPEVNITFLGDLHDFQVEAVDAMEARYFGTLAAPTGSGKTVMALALIARRRQPALIVVHTTELLNQWVGQIEKFLGISARKIGKIGGSNKKRLKIGGQITVALVQSLCKCASEVAPHIGHLVIDECHRAPSRTFTEAVTAFDSRFMLGLSATPWRRDGLSRLIYWYIGDKVHEVDKGALEEAGHVLRAEVIWRETDFESSFNPAEEYSQMLSELTQDPARNGLIAQDVAREANGGGGVCLVLSDRKDHCKALVALLAGRGVKADLLTGDLSNGERQTVVAALNAGQVKVLVATGQLIGEGFDCKEFSTLFLACPVKFSGRLLQYLGRVLRPAPGKEKARVFDYVDLKIGVLKNSAEGRARVYAGESGGSHPSPPSLPLK